MLRNNVRFRPGPLKILAVVTGLSLCASIAVANVSLKNGNFFIGYTDAEYSGGFELKVERVYNSKTAFKGMFGQGWGSEYEAFLTVMGDGSVLLQEYGGGAENSFLPPAPAPALLDLTIEELANAAVRRQYVKPQDVEGYRQKLRTGAEFRNDEWNKYVKLREVRPRRLAAGTVLTSHRFANQTIRRTSAGFERVTEGGGRTEQFDSLGKLLRITDSNNNFLDFAYGPDGRLATITDNFKRWLKFAFGANGLVQSVTMIDGRKATYVYNSKDELIESTDVDRNRYRFAYTADGRHNLSSITYSDGTTMEITYHPLALYENVKSVKDRDGTFTTYDYVLKANAKPHLAVAVRVYQRRGGEKIGESRYEYTNFPDEETKQGGTAEMLTIQEGTDSVHTVYDKKCGLPVLVDGNAASLTRLSYDTECHVVFKDTRERLDSIVYNLQVGKIARVMSLEKDASRRVVTNFRYDTRGNLTHADNTDSISVDLEYESNGRISRMTAPSGVLTFKYNINSKPIEIAHDKLGAITITYDTDGEIKDVKSSGGREIALQITSAFQTLLDLIRPAGVTLGM